MENYFNAKKILFEKYMRNNWQGSVNIDDEYGRRLRDFLGKRAITYAMLDESADFFASIKNFSLDAPRHRDKNARSAALRRLSCRYSAATTC